MKFSISKEVFEHLDDLSIGIIIAEDIENRKSSAELEELISEIVELVNANSSPTSSANNRMISPWKSAYFSFGEKPHSTHSSMERLTNEIMETSDIKRKNKLKDLCNFISLKHTVPVECFDIEKIQGDLLLKRAKGDEFFYDYGSGKALNPEKGEFIYTDKINVLARKLDYVESDKALVSMRTKKTIILIEGLKPLKKQEVSKITKETAELAEAFCNAKARIFVLDKNNSTIEF
jgi:DNA/RNA-binding domain of Phe-tRNA-synthetase-like protein